METIVFVYAAYASQIPTSTTAAYVLYHPRFIYFYTSFNERTLIEAHVKVYTAVHTLLHQLQ
jgi:hypothetical protein